MSDLQQYKCPCCDGAIEFDTSSQNLKCPYCGTEFEPDTVISYNDALNSDGESDMEWESAGGSSWSEGEQESLVKFVCESCGGEIITDATTAATSCPYCSNPVTVTQRLSGELRPDMVIPFKLDKKAATEALKQHYKGKKLLPKVFKSENRIKEIKGIYVPFFVYEADADANIRYKATRVRTWSDSNYIYTETSHYSVLRAGTLGFADLPVDSSSKMADDLMESIEPFDFSQAVDFNTAYLAGFFADKYDVGEEECIPRANERIKNTTERAFLSTVIGYTTTVPVATSVKLANKNVKYALLPVWVLNSEWKGKKYTFAMNGQTGKMVGDLPMDKGAFFRWFFGISAASAAVCAALLTLFWFI